MKLKRYRLNHRNPRDGATVHYSNRERALKAAHEITARRKWCQVIDLTQGFEVRIF